MSAAPDTRLWPQQLQRRVLRLLLQHDQRLMRDQFRSFYTGSELPRLPVFAQYDRLLALRTRSAELLDDLMPRIRRQLSLQTDQHRLLEESPTRGEIDWPRSIGRGWGETPGLPPTRFETRLRQRSSATPENLFVVAVLLDYRAHIRSLLTSGPTDEPLTEQERLALTQADEQAERELAAAYARALVDQARHSELPQLAALVEARLRPGPNPYRDLLEWWRRFSVLRVGRSDQQRGPTLAPLRDDPKTDAWLYELWIMLEILHLLDQRGMLAPADVTVQADRLSAVYQWEGEPLRISYNRQIDGGPTGGWRHSPGVRPDYAIERAAPLEVRDGAALVWREPPVLLDAKFYLDGSDPARTHGPIKKLLGDMALLGASQCVLFFPLLPEPPEGQHITRTVEPRPEQHHGGLALHQQIHLCHLDPLMDVSELQVRLAGVLAQAAGELTARPRQIVCQGVCLDTDTINPSRSVGLPPMPIICPKPHIGPGVYDLVSREHDCLRNGRVCHVKGRAIIPPFVIRASSQSELNDQAGGLRAQSDDLLRELEARQDDAGEAQAEQLRAHIFTGVGRAIEQYVRLRGNTQTIEAQLEEWVFGDYWQQHARALAPETRAMLKSGEYVWQEYTQTTDLTDWAAPTIQYCRALELELRRRLYNHYPGEYHLPRVGWTLGSPFHAFKRQDTHAQDNWNLFLRVVSSSNSDSTAFEAVIQRMDRENIKDKRNQLAHGDPVPRSMAESIRRLVIGTRQQPGALCWLAESLEPLEAGSDM